MRLLQKSSQLGLILFLFFILYSCNEAPQRDCAQFKNGRFEFSSLIEGDTLRTVFERKGEIEVEYFQGSQDTSTVRWINDCEYILKKRRPKTRAEEKSVHIKILTTTDSSYTFEFSAVDEPKKLRGTAFKTN